MLSTNHRMQHIVEPPASHVTGTGVGPVLRRLSAMGQKVSRVVQLQRTQRSGQASSTLMWLRTTVSCLSSSWTFSGLNLAGKQLVITHQSLELATSTSFSIVCMTLVHTTDAHIVALACTYAWRWSLT